MSQARVVLFADVSGSSTLYKQIGDEKAKQIIDIAVAEMCTFSEEHHGKVVKTIGDEVMVRFDDPIDAFNAARTIQNHFANKKISIRIGMAYGDTLLDKNDVFGRTVNDAAYIAQMARGEQILINADLLNSLPGGMSEDCHEYDRVKIKGESTTSTIYRVHWERGNTGEFATQFLTSEDFGSLLQNAFLTLSFEQHEVTISHLQTPYKIGRGGDNGLALSVDSALASRSHCDIYFQHGKFILVDHSTNGTYVQQEGQLPVYLRREELPLVGQGIISVGGPIAHSDSLIHFNL